MISGGRSSSGLGKSKLSEGSSISSAIGWSRAKRLGARLGLLGGGGAGGIARDIVLQPLALGLLLGLGRGDLRLPFGALALEGIVAAGIKRQLAAPRCRM